MTPPASPPRADARPARRTPSAARISAGQPQRVEIPGWELLDLVGEGRVARLFAARPAHSPGDGPADYVVKILRPEFEQDPIAVHMLQNEACVGRRVSHPHVVSVLVSRVSESPRFVVMPRLEGASCDLKLAAVGRLSLAMSLWICRQAAQALAALHQAQWLHGDVKPGNIVVSPRGHATLIDLGLASPLEQPTSLAERPLAGTLAYTAPELFTSTGCGDQRSDLYSLGATLFELITGRPPFGGLGPAQLAEAHLHQAPPLLRSLAPTAPPALARLVESLLAKDPMRRPRSATELVSELVKLEIECFADRSA